MTKLKSLLTNLSAIAGMFLFFFVAAANAATLTVSSTADSGAGSLRQALSVAVTSGVANDIVFDIPTFDPNYDAVNERFTITLATALPNLPVPATTITNTMPQNVTIVANNVFRVFYVSSNSSVTITNLTMSNGGGQGSTSGPGGAIYVGTNATLTLNDSTITNSTAVNYGGGIFVNTFGTLNMNRCTVTGNTANEYGGGLWNDTGTVNVNDSTFSGNVATQWEGGAILNAGPMTIVNSTISGNSSSIGGAISNYDLLTITSSTIVENSAVQVGGIYNEFGTVSLDNTIVAENTADSQNDLLGSFTGNYNLIGIINGGSGLSPITNMWGDSETSLDPMIGPLQDNGGPTMTHALLEGSPAIDKGYSYLHSTEQRGYDRIYDNVGIPNAADGADIGAFEALAPSSAGVSISGQFMTSAGKGGQGIANVTVYLTDEAGNVQTARTNAFGYFQFPEVAAGMTYIATASHRQHQFETKVISVTDEIGGLNWTPMNAAPASSNRTSKSGLR